MTPLAADRIRKLLGYALALGITLLLFRVLGRTADGRQGLADPELIGLAVLIALSVTWVRAARRIRRADLAAKRGFDAPGRSDAAEGTRAVGGGTNPENEPARPEGESSTVPERSESAPDAARNQ